MTIQTPQHAVLEISRKNSVSNFNWFRSKLRGSTKMMILIKANSYGHGDIEFASVMKDAGADYFGVATPAEGVKLKRAGLGVPILVLSGGMDSYPMMIEEGLEFSIPNIPSLLRFRETIREMGIASYPVHLAFDTGMHRLGFQPGEIGELTKILQENPGIEILSFYSHLAASDEQQHDQFTLGQISLFERVTKEVSDVLGYQPMKHILNSAGIERFTQYQFDMVRLGIGIYGISSTGSRDLKPASYFRAPIIQINELSNADGSTVGYGRHGKLKDGLRRIAVIPVGYADGVDRHLGRGKASFEVKGSLVPTIGNICMDMCMVDITDTDAQIGDFVTIFGDEPHASELAKTLGTIPYEIFTSVASRVSRRIVD